VPDELGAQLGRFAVVEAFAVVEVIEEDLHEHRRAHEVVARIGHAREATLVQPYRRLYATQRWRSTARFVIARAGGVCEVRGCGRPATSADHHPTPALELYLTGRLELFFDLGNLRASCASCNSRAGAQLRNGKQRLWLLAQSSSEAWAVRYEADQERLRLARERAATAPSSPPWPTPRIY
jgi:hypothetical protein